MNIILEDAMFCDDCQINVDALEVVSEGNEIKLVGECVDCNARIVDTYEFAGRESEAIEAAKPNGGDDG